MKSPRYDTLVIGAGAAGLNAGRTLAQAGQRVLLLEARKRVGGRIWTQRASPTRLAHSLPIELGAEFLHGLPEATWSLVREANLPTYELSGASFWYASGELKSGDERPSDAGHVLEGVVEKVSGQADFEDLSFADYLNGISVAATSAQAARNYVEGFNAADQQRISVAALAKQQLAEDAICADRLFRVESGYAAIPEFLAKQFVQTGGELILEAEVRGIAWQRGAVTIETHHPGGVRQFQAQRVVITVPLSVLHAERIEFEPRPAETLHHAHRLAMGSVMRMVFVFERKVWDETLSFLIAPSELPSAWWTPMPRTSPTLTAWAGGPKAESMLRLVTAAGDATALRQQCLASLAKMLRVPLVDIDNHVESSHFHNWQTDPHALGAYSYVPAGALDAPGYLQLPVEDTLYFAGEHTDTSGHWGTVHAALATGRAAALKILNTGAARG